MKSRLRRVRLATVADTVIGRMSARPRFLTWVAVLCPDLDPEFVLDSLRSYINWMSPATGIEELLRLSFQPAPDLLGGRGTEVCQKDTFQSFGLNV